MRVIERSTFISRVGAILRGQGGADAGVRPGQVAVELAVVTAIAAGTYGAAMGSYAAVHGGPALQMLYSAVKTPMFLLVTFGLTLPGYAVIGTLLGLRRDLGEAITVLLTGQAMVAIALLSMAPLTLFWYVNVRDYNSAVLFNGLAFALASFGAQAPLRQRLRHLIRRSPGHLWLLRAWLGTYVFTGVQMGWALRPFIGSPTSEVAFFRGGDWDNAYVIVARMFWRAVNGP